MRFIAFVILTLGSSLLCFGQPNSSIPYKSQEISETEGVPVILMHLPEWEKVRAQAVFIKSTDELVQAVGYRPLLDVVDFSGGTEAAAANYGAGRLLIIEYSTPQASIDADNRFTAMLGNGEAGVVYRRIGNYNAFVFDAAETSAANALLDQVKYEKTVQWLGRNPFDISAERAFVLTTADLFVSTVLVILMGIGFSIVGGLIVGYTFFIVREQKRARMSTFTDAGGMTRLNLDGFTPEIVPKGFLKD